MHVTGSRRLRYGLVVIAGLSAWTPLWADETTNTVIRAQGTGFDGSGVRIAIVEAEGGLAQLAPTNPTMPDAGPAAGANGKHTRFVNPFYPGAPAPADASHATMVSSIVQSLNGRSVAPNSIVFSSYSSGANDNIQVAQRMFQPVASGGLGCSVLNLSLSGSAGTADATSNRSKWIDWSVVPDPTGPYGNKVIVIAGNETGAAARTNPWDAFNGITVGATGGADFRTLASYNATAATRNITTDASPYGNGRIGRFKTDMVAPGGGDGGLIRNSARFGSGEDNGNYLALHPRFQDGLNDSVGYAGTSFAAPHVTGAAAQVLQAAGNALESRATKAILLNGASKNVSDATRPVNDRAWRPRGDTAWTKGTNNTRVRIGWDENLGTGLLDVQNSISIVQGGRYGPGETVRMTSGFDANEIRITSPTNQYLVKGGGAGVLAAGLLSITATLTWDRQSDLTTDANSDGLWQPGDVITTFTLNDLDLELWNITDNLRVSWSNSDMDNIEHVSAMIADADKFDTFGVRVVFSQQFSRYLDTRIQDIEEYGIAWSLTAVPAPGGGLILIASGVLALRRRRSGPDA